MLNRVVFLALLVALLVSTTQAQVISLGPQLGFQKTKDTEKGGMLVGATLRLKLSAALKAEGVIAYRQEKENDGALTIRSWPIMVTGLLYPLPILYGAVGAGWHNTTFDYDQNQVPLKDETSQEFGWHFGGGIELPIGGKTKLVGDVRFVFLNFKFDQIPFQDVKGDFYIVSGGILFGL